MTVDRFLENTFIEVYQMGKTYSVLGLYVYSKAIDSVFCSCCKLFKSGTFSLASHDNRDWKNIGDILKNHENSPNHKNALGTKLERIINKSENRKNYR